MRACEFLPFNQYYICFSNQLKMSTKQNKLICLNKKNAKKNEKKNYSNI